MNIWLGEDEFRMSAPGFESQGQSFHPIDWQLSDGTFDLGKIQLVVSDGKLTLTAVS